MNARQPTTALSETANSAVTLLVEVEIPRNTAFDAFEEQLEAQLAELETRFSDFVTRDSLAGSIGR
jgi:hypothetical protein